MKKIVILGGGTGLSSVLRGIKKIPDIDLKVIITVADSGGSTGSIRQQYNIPAIGDIRQVASTLSNNHELFDLLMNHRFNTLDKNNSLHNHSLGNLFILSLYEKANGNFYQAIQNLSKILRINGEIIPITDYSSLTLKAIYDDGSYALNEHNIPQFDKKISELTYLNLKEIKPNPRAIKAIQEADFIFLSPGSIFTSIIANLIIPGIKEAINDNQRAEILYIANIVTQPNETKDFNDLQHITTIERYIAPRKIDTVFINSQVPENELLNKYKNHGYDFIKLSNELKSTKIKIINTDLLDVNNHQVIRHDYQKIKAVIESYIKGE